MKYWSSLQDFERVRMDFLGGTTTVDAALLRTRPPSFPVMRIYYGPPGTGKTIEAVRFAVELADPEWNPPDTGDPNARLAAIFERFWSLQGQVEFITFSPGDQYETIVEAIRPAMEDRGEVSQPDLDSQAPSPLETRQGSPTQEGPGEANGLQYSYWRGPVLRIIERALSNPMPHVLVIDEINRADISQVLGPLLAAIDSDKRLGSLFPVPFQLRYAPESANQFIPANLHIIGTMNSTDRNIALVDAALRRRFTS